MSVTTVRASGGAPVIETERLVLRPWAEEDRVPFAALNADPQAMRYFPSVLERAESDAMVETARQRSHEDGFCFQPAAIKATGRFIGFVGLNRPRHALPFAWNSGGGSLAMPGDMAMPARRTGPGFDSVSKPSGLRRSSRPRS